MYPVLKNLHVSLVLLSIAGFVLRWSWRQAGSQLTKHRLTRVLPHLLDTFLLLSGIGLMMLIHQYPVTDAWLTSKMLGLLAYILLGGAAMKLAPRRWPSRTAFAMAILAFAWMISVASSKHAAGILQ
ncbi:MAG: SirB2 family protein [Xanthomonadales bacterium]|nr:SirB2 family protein [Gammaproteobacteria bacterium]NNE06475.1 SirB2 family protein [Xanthomonadales bacterium]NNL95935.1 SirB2 family protein [Xanthomonadales bacterium]